MALRPCKVLIAGWGIVGLAFAIVMEMIGVDYFLLEAYSAIVTEVGAGICLMPNGVRVLDQLGCYEDLLSSNITELLSVGFRNTDGEPLAPSLDGSVITERYSILPLLCIRMFWSWVDHQMLLDVLYNRISDKFKGVSQKCVARVSHAEDHVEVTASDGSTFRGDILVGADGTHSRLGIQDYDEDTITATYAGISGTSTEAPGVPTGCLSFVTNKHFSYIIEKEALLREHANDNITSTVRFDDLYKSKIRAIQTPLAALANNPVAVLSQSSSLGAPLTAELPAVFQQVQDLRVPRVSQVVQLSRHRQQLDGLETPGLSDFMLYNFSKLPPGALLQRWDET
ncbi:FAD-dependent oxidoreductase [Aspergillus alliaceus]|uniref:FAD-dependent oxidoreductase n=1 Tax=Petromyces alliaceus TaxID=209559 RepID=UPI0012A490D2|nr:uncharacterized protein BDW43DRAFT_321307 [Aspergillus alliaceus]KAB8238276.1 hypothetical protein BDW43DRAFT_321307 [Aspergillus alliaceus]